MGPLSPSDASSIWLPMACNTRRVFARAPDKSIRSSITVSYSSSGRNLAILAPNFRRTRRAFCSTSSSSSAFFIALLAEHLRFCYSDSPMSPLSIDVPYSGGQIDASLDLGADVILFEFKGSLLKVDAKYKRNVTAFQDDFRLDRKSTRLN